MDTGYFYGDSPSSSLCVSVAVRDATFRIEVGQGTQTFQWLADVAAARYAATHTHLAGGATNLTPTAMVDANGNALFPAEVICERVEDGAMLRLEVVGPRLGLATDSFRRERAMWELYAYSAHESPLGAALVPLVFLFDASELALSEPPAVFGNFNAWSRPIPMQWWKASLYKHQVDLPAGAEVVFKFVVGGAAVLTPHVYPLVHDSRGNKLHFLRVAPLPPLTALDATQEENGQFAGGVSTDGSTAVAPVAEVPSSRRRVFTLREVITLNQRAQAAYLARESLARNGPELPVLSARVVGTYPGSRVVRGGAEDERASRRLADRDWRDLAANLADIFPQPSARGPPPARPYSDRLDELRTTVYKHHEELTSLFLHYARGVGGCGPKGPTWNLLTFLEFLHLVRVPESHGRATIARLDKIFYQVVSRNGRPAGSTGSSKDAGDLPLSSAALRAANNSLGKATSHAEDPFAPIAQMPRSAFVEALIRVAMLRYRNPASLSDYIPPEPSAEDTKTRTNDGTAASNAAGGAARAAVPPAPLATPVPASDANPALSLELLMRLHLRPFALAQPQATSGLYTPQVHDPNELRQRLIADTNVLAILEAYSPDLRRLFAHYTGGAPASGVGLGLVHGGGVGGAGVGSGIGTAGAFGVVGGTGGANASQLPPTLLGSGYGVDPLLGASRPGGPGSAHHPNGRLKTSGVATIASATIHLRELEAMLADYEMLDPYLPRARALAHLGIASEGEAADAGGVGGEPERALELLYPEWLELLVRVGDTGPQWSNLYREQQRLIAEAIAAGTLSPLDKPPASMLIAGGGLGAAAGLDDDHDEDGAPRRADDTELCERVLRLCQWLFPTEEEQRERRARIAAQQSAQAAPVVVATTTTKDDKKEAEEANGAATGKDTAKGRAKTATTGRATTAAKKTTGKK